MSDVHGINITLLSHMALMKQSFQFIERLLVLFGFEFCAISTSSSHCPIQFGPHEVYGYGQLIFIHGQASLKINILIENAVNVDIVDLRGAKARKRTRFILTLKGQVFSIHLP